MEGGVVEHDDHARLQVGNKLLLQPQVECVRIACALEQERRYEFFADQPGNQAGARAAVARAEAVYALAAQGIAIVSLRREFKARFIDINERAALLRQFVMALEVTAATICIVQRFPIPPRFFYGSTSFAASRS